jgi:hypothetical protein
MTAFLLLAFALNAAMQVHIAGTVVNANASGANSPTLDRLLVRFVFIKSQVCRQLPPDPTSQ